MSCRAVEILVSLALLLAPVRVAAQVDFDAFRIGYAGCPEMAADPDVGTLAAFLCRPLNRSSLDSPINLTGFGSWEVPAGSFSPFSRPTLTAAARSFLGESEFARLQALLIGAQVLSRSQDALRLALLAEGDAAGAAALLGSPADSFDANIPALLAARVDRDRYADWRAGVLGSLGGRDTVGQYEIALADSLVANIGGLPQSSDGDGDAVFTLMSASTKANPAFFGPDGIRDTADDLPFVANNPRAQAAGYALTTPITQSGPADQDRFDATFGRNSASDRIRAKYALTAQISVPSASAPGAMKLVELYGVYSDDWLINQGCSAAGGSYNRLEGTCQAGAEDRSAQALALGCGATARNFVTLNIGTNADGHCIELNTTSPAQPSGQIAPDARVQFEVIALLGDPAVRPIGAEREPVDLTDLRLFVDGGANNLLPARPRASGAGNVVFPVAAPFFRRRVDPSTGAPVSATGSECTIRENGSGQAVGPNGIALDGDDEIPSAGDCLLWGVPDGSGVQRLLPPDSVAGSHPANQSLFHTLCTVSYDADAGFCFLDRLNSPVDFGLVSNILSGLGVLGAILMSGLETIQVENPDGSSSVTQRGSSLFIDGQLLAIEPLAFDSQSTQDLTALRVGQSSLLGCGAAYASPCSAEQATDWRSDPAMQSSLARGPESAWSWAGGIDWLNANASVVRQEFTRAKYEHAGSLVGAVGDEGPSSLAFLPGINFSRTGQAAMDVDADFTRQGVQIVVPSQQFSIEAGAYLALTPDDVASLGAAGRASYQLEPGNLREADGWVEPMPWKIDQDLLARFGAIVFKTDPANPLDLDSPLNDWNMIDSGGAASYSNIDGEYCGRWMNPEPTRVATPFNLGCTGLETISANLERFMIGAEQIGQDRVFDPPESLAELVAMLDGDPSSDATGDPIAGPDGIFARNQFVIDDDEMDFEVVRTPIQNPGDGSDYLILSVPVLEGADPKLAAEAFLADLDPNTECASRPWCYLRVDDVLVDPGDATAPGSALILAMPIGFEIDVVTPSNPSDPNAPVEDTGVDTKVNLAALQYFELPKLRRLFASQFVEIGTPGGPVFVRMSTAQRNELFGEFGSNAFRGRDMDGDGSADLDRNRDGVWDGQDDYLPGPISDDNLLCGSGIPGDRLQDGIQYRPYRADERPGTPAFDAAFPDGLAPRSPVFCRTPNSLLALIGPIPGATPGESDAFLWHGGLASPDADDDADGWPDALDSCPTIANADQADADGDGVGDVCDSCVLFPNPRVGDGFLAANPWATLTGGQRDDDRDGYGNACDADFTPLGALVATGDLRELRASLGKSRSEDSCGAGANLPCAIFDLGESGEMIDSDDLRRFRELIGKPPGPKCAACPLVCEAGAWEGCE